MKIDPKWLLPPAAALLLLLGPLSMQTDKGKATADPAAGQTPATAPAKTNPATEEPAAARTGQGRLGSAVLPKTPDLLQVTMTLAGLLVLAGLGIWALRRLRDGKTSRPGNQQGVASLRQVIRLSAKHVVYAVDFDDQVLLIGATDQGLALLHSGRGEKADEAAVAARALDEDDDGAVPRNLVIPRPAPAQRPLPKPPRTTPPAPAPQEPRPLGDFRALLQKAGKA